MTRIHQVDLARPIGDFLKPVETLLKEEWTVTQALESLRGREIKGKIVYFYIVDNEQRLLGVVPTRRLLLAKADAVLASIMSQPVICIKDSMTLGETMHAFSHHQFLALPVVDSHNKILGMIDIAVYAEEHRDVTRTRVQNDLFQLIGMSAEGTRRITPWRAFRIRMPWLLCNIFSGILCAIIAAAFNHLLSRIILIAMFIPLVLTVSESIAMQSMSLTLQYLHRSEIPWRLFWGRAAREGQTSLLLGLASGLIVAGVVTFWGAGFPTMMVLAISVAASMIACAAVGVAIPASLHVLHLDPKVAAGPVGLMLADVITTAVYLGTGTLLLL